MNYNRYLDLHLCTSTDIAALKTTYANRMFFDHNGHTYFYQFTDDMMKQMRYREGKTEGFTLGDKGNCKILSSVELTDAGDGFLTTISTLDTTGGVGRVSYTIHEQLKQLRYVGCMVAIEKLKMNTVYQQLQALMLWISDPHTANKLRVNCHGSGTASGGFSMGTQEMSPEEFVNALVRHGLAREEKAKQDVSQLAHAARWKKDNEKTACENCNKQFSFVRRRHHCRRCGGLFCDTCSSKKLDLAIALTGETPATVKNVKRARVCDKCYADACFAAIFRGDAVLEEVMGGRPAEPHELKYGLQQITLALCMGAKSDAEFSQERDPLGGGGGEFVRDSLAFRVLGELRRHNLNGIRLTASNQVVASTDTGIENRFGIEFPRAFQAKKFVGRYKRCGVGRPEFEVPAYIFGEARELKNKLAALRSGSSRTFGDEITVSAGGRSPGRLHHNSRADKDFEQVVFVPAC